MQTKGIGLQGLGVKGNNGYSIGSEDSPTKKKDACYSKVKSRYKKWPSAYARKEDLLKRQGLIVRVTIKDLLE
jgi:hypothetical protein